MNEDASFDQGLRALDNQTLEWDRPESFLTPTRKPRTAPEVFLLLTNPVYGLGINLFVAGRVEFYERLVQWAKREAITDQEIIEGVKELAKKHGAEQAAPLVALDLWLTGIHRVLRDLQTKRVEFTVDEKAMVFHWSAVPGYELN